MLLEYNPLLELHLLTPCFKVLGTAIQAVPAAFLALSDSFVDIVARLLLIQHQAAQVVLTHVLSAFRKFAWLSFQHPGPRLLVDLFRLWHLSLDCLLLAEDVADIEWII